ncbi:MAG: ECF transporter S component [Patescibacteria group bacterium]|nr:ECF transporter S component [Patescibacteria group bacterium]
MFNSPAQIYSRTTVKLSTLKWALFSTIFTALSVGLPWVAHQFNLAGSVYLPMHFFVLVAALLAGWRVGLAVGIITPLVSYLVSGMPLLPVLPQITVEIAAYGLSAGVLRGPLKMNTWVSLIGAMVIGRLALAVAALFLGSKIGFMDIIVNVVKVGWPGILIQFALVVILVKWLFHYLEKDNK